MKLKPDFVLRKIADTWVILPLGDDILNFNGMLSLNNSGVLLWKILESGGDREEMISKLTEKYDVSRQQAISDVDQFIDKLSQVGCFE